MEPLLYVLLVIVGAALIAFRVPLTNYQRKVYPASMQPDRSIVLWGLVGAGILAIVVGALGFLGFRFV